MLRKTKTFFGWIAAILVSFSPTLYCDAFNISDFPSTVISGPESGLTRPEGVSFSPSGDCLAIADSNSNSILIYKYSGNVGLAYETTPSIVIRDNTLLGYAHDLEFSTCGKFIAASSRDSHTIALYKKNGKEGYAFETQPFWSMNGEASSLNNPASVCFSPNGNILAVCNRMGGSGITFYNQIENSKGKYNLIPFQSITETALLENNISAPHGIAFSPDGKTIAVVHKTYYKDRQRLGMSALAIYELTENPLTPFNPTPVFFSLLDNQALHSIAYHPSGNYLATINEEGWVTIYQKVAESNAFVLIKTLNIIGMGNKRHSPKGIDFSPDGNSLAVTLELPAVYIYAITD